MKVIQIEKMKKKKKIDTKKQKNKYLRIHKSRSENQITTEAEQS